MYEQYNSLDFWDVQKHASILIQQAVILNPRYNITQDAKLHTLKCSAKRKYIKSLTETEFPAYQCCLPRSPLCRIVYMVFMCHPTKFFQLGFDLHFIDCFV